jgi:hypothetical protein
VKGGSSIDDMVGMIEGDLKGGGPVALGIEAPLFLPVPTRAGDLSKGSITGFPRPSREGGHRGGDRHGRRVHVRQRLVRPAFARSGSDPSALKKYLLLGHLSPHPRGEVDFFA